MSISIFSENDIVFSLHYIYSITLVTSYFADPKQHMFILV